MYKHIALLIVFLLSIAPTIAYSSDIKQDTIPYKKEKRFTARYTDGILLIFRNGKLISNAAVNAGYNARVEFETKDECFFVACGAEYDTEFRFIGILDINTLEWIVQKNANKGDMVLANSNFIGVSPDRKFYVIEGGTSASLRYFQLYDETGLLRFGRTYIPASNLIWKKDNSIEYFVKSDDIPEYFPEFSGFNNIWIRKFAWTEMDIVTTDVYKQFYIE